MAFEHFPLDQIFQLADAIVSANLDYNQVRPVALGGLNPHFRAAMPPPGLPAKPQALLDLQTMNQIERLADGTVPLKSWLQSMVSLAGVTVAADIFGRRLGEIQIRTTGAPSIIAGGLPETKEAIIHQDDMVPHAFMEQGAAAAKSVAKLSVHRYDNGVARMNGPNPVLYLGTGWLIAPGLLVTNHHVVNARNAGEPSAAAADLRQQVSSATALFDYDYDGAPGTMLPLGEVVASDIALDYAVIRVTERGRMPLVLAPVTLRLHDPPSQVAVNIIQHPDGKPKKFAIRNNLVTSADEREIRYFTDTFNGSSGSPVLDDTWRVVGLHRGSVFVRGVKYQGRDVAYVNVGTPSTGIVADLKSRFAGKLPELGI
jgi:endonuclease G